MPMLLFQSSSSTFPYTVILCVAICVSIDLSTAEAGEKIMQDVKRCRQGCSSELGVLVARAAAFTELIHHNAIFDILACRNCSSPKSIFVSSARIKCIEDSCFHRSEDYMAGCFQKAV